MHTPKAMLNRPMQGNASENFSGPVKLSCLEFHSRNVERTFPPGLPYALQAKVPAFLAPANLDHAFYIPHPVRISKTQRGVLLNTVGEHLVAHRLEGPRVWWAWGLDSSADYGEDTGLSFESLVSFFGQQELQTMSSRFRGRNKKIFTDSRERSREVLSEGT